MSAIPVDSEEVIPICHFEAAALLDHIKQNTVGIERTAASTEIMEEFLEYIHVCQKFKNEATATNAKKAIAAFNAASEESKSSETNSFPSITPLEASQILSLGQFTVEKAFLVNSICDKFTDYKEQQQMLLDRLEHLSSK